MRVLYKRKGEYQGSEMTVGEEYEVIGIEDDYYRIISNKNEPCLYHSNQFEIINNDKPDFWVTETGSEGELNAYPFSMMRDYFFEDYFNNKESVVKHFWSEYKRLYENNKNV